MEKRIFIIVITVVVLILGAVFVFKNFYVSDKLTPSITSRILPPRQLPAAPTPPVYQETTLPQVAPTPTPTPKPVVKLPVSVNGVCGSSLNSCTAGTFQDITDTGILYLWNCFGSGGGANAVCNLAKPPVTSSSVLDRIEAAIKAKLKR